RRRRARRAAVGDRRERRRLDPHGVFVKPGPGHGHETLGRVKAYELIAEAVAAHDVDTVFGLLGDGNMFPLAALVERHGTRLVNARHENAAVLMADGWARVSGRVGVASVTCGPGLAQVTTALTGAVRNRTPLVVLAGEVPQGTAWNPQRTDQGLLVAATGARYLPVATPSLLVAAIQEAFVVAE